MTAVRNMFKRILTGVSDCAERWRDFWFRPEDALTLGIIRVLTGWMLAYNLFVWGLDLHTFFGSNGLQPLDAIRRFHGNDLTFSFLFYVDDDWLQTVHWSCFAIAVLFCLGAASRLTSILCFLITISYSQRVPVANFGLDQILGLLCFYLAIGPSGETLSVDAMVRRHLARRRRLNLQVRKLSSARISLRLIQIHLCIIYFWAGFAKLKGDSWWTGEAMWQVLANQEYQTIDLTWMAWVPWLPYLIAHVTVAWEVFFCVLVWNRFLRPWMLLIGTAMHFGIGAFMGMWTFGLIMTYAYFSFSSPSAWRRRLRPLAKACGLSSAQFDDSVPDSSLPDQNNTPLPARRSQDLEAQVTKLPSLSQDTSVLILSTDPAERQMLRRYLKRHDIPATAAANLEVATSIALKLRPAVLLISGTRQSYRDLNLCIEDLIDATGAPTVAIVTPNQKASLLQDRIAVTCLDFPLSLRDVRHQLKQIMLGASESGSDAASSFDAAKTPISTKVSNS